jgi:hypothetical protein
LRGKRVEFVIFVMIVIIKWFWLKEQLT